MKHKFDLIFIFLFSILIISLIPLSDVNAATVTLTPPTADTYLDTYNSNQNYGGSSTINVEGGSTLVYKQRTLLKFDLSSIPSGTIITKATLRLHASGYWTPITDQTLTVYRVTEDWVEMQATWNDRMTSTAWSPSAGGTWTTTGSVTQTAVSSGPISWDVTQIVKAWIESGENNFGFLIKLTDESGTNYWQQFASSTYYDIDSRPVLEIDCNILSAQTVDISNHIREDFLTSENIYVTGSGFPPGVPVNIHIVNDGAWTLGDSIPTDVSSDGVNSVITDISGNIGKTLVWPQPTVIGEYDIIFDVNPNGQYDAGDFVYNPHDPGFTISVFDTSSVAVGGFYIPVNGLAVLLPYLALAIMIIVVSAVLVKRNRCKA